MKIFAVKDEKVGYISVVNEENVDVAKFNFGRGFYCEHPEFGRLEDYMKKFWHSWIGYN